MSNLSPNTVDLEGYTFPSAATAPAPTQPKATAPKPAAPKPIKGINLSPFILRAMFLPFHSILDSQVSLI